MALREELKRCFDDEKFDKISKLYNDLKNKVESSNYRLQTEIKPESSDDGRVKSKSIIFENLRTSVNQLIGSLQTTINEVKMAESPPVTEEKESLELYQTNLTELGQRDASLEPKVKEEEVVQTSNLEKTGSEDESGLIQKETSVAPEGKEESATESTPDLIEDPQNTIPRGVVVDPDRERIYVADWNCRCIRVYDYGCNYVEYMRISVGISPWGLALSNRKLYITDNRNDKVIYISLLKRESQLKRVDLEGPFKSPRGIAVDSRGQVFVADCNNDRIVTFDKGKRSQLETHVLKRPVDVEVVENNLYIMCLYLKGEKRELYILKHTIGMQNYDEIISEKNINAFFFCIHENNIYLSDMLGHSIRKYHCENKFPKTSFSEKGHGKEQLFYPSGISVNKNSQIVIGSSNRGNRIQMFMPHFSPI